MLFDSLIQIRDPEPHSAAMNMALDEVLHTKATEPLIRIYRWRCRAISFGYFARHAAVSAGWPGYEIVRRMTGGGIVEHGADITYTLVIPAAHSLSQRNARESYCAIHTALAGRLRSQGIAASLAAAPENGGNGVCFQSAAEADVISAGSKLAGAAQRRTQHGLLYQGSIQGVPDELRTSLPSAFAANIQPRDFTPDELTAARDLTASKYATRAWTERV